MNFNLYIRPDESIHSLQSQVFLDRPCLCLVCLYSTSILDHYDPQNTLTK